MGIQNFHIARLLAGENPFDVGYGGPPRTPVDRFNDGVRIQDLNVTFDDDDFADTNDTRIEADLPTIASDGRKVLGGLDKTLWLSAASIPIEDSLAIELDPKFVIKGISGVVGTVLTIQASPRARFDISGGEIDTSLRTYVEGVGSGTGLTLRFLDDFSVRRMRFTAGADYRDLVGDSGISVNQCQRGVIEGNTFSGHPDLGIYLTGGANTDDSDDYGDIAVVHNFFVYCAGALSSKRQMGRVLASNNITYRCRTGFSLSETEVPPNEKDPGRALIVTSNIFEKLQSRAIIAKLGKVVCTGNYIKDWGYDLAGDPADVTDIIRIHANDGVYTGNLLEMADWLGDGTGSGDYQGASLSGFRLQQLALQSGTIVPANNLIANNSIKGIAIGIREETGVSGNFGRNLFSGVATPIIKASGSTSIFSAEGPSQTGTVTLSFDTTGDFSPTYTTQSIEWRDDGAFIEGTGLLVFSTNAYTTASGAFRINFPSAMSLSDNDGVSGQAVVTRMDNIVFSEVPMWRVINNARRIQGFVPVSGSGSTAVGTTEIPPSTSGIRIEFSFRYKKA